MSDETPKHPPSLTEDAHPARVADMLARDLARVTAERDAAKALLREWTESETEYTDGTGETTCGECQEPRADDGPWRFKHRDGCRYIRTRVACGLPVPT